MSGTRTGVPGGHNDLTRELMLNVHVKLLNRSLPEAEIFGDEV